MDSPFQQRLGTSYIPSVNEARQIQNLLEISSKEVHDIDMEISQLQKRLDLLQIKRLKIFDLAEQYHALLSPARRLSQDILAEIFLACLPTDRNPCMSAKEAPMLLTQICSSWRSIAHSTPRLWAAIHIVLPSIYNNIPPDSYIPERKFILQRKLNQREAATKEWPERSGACPLFISIYQGRQTPVVRNTQKWYSSFIINTIVPHYKRWYNIDMYITADALIHSMLKGGPGLTGKHLKMLKYLHITIDQTFPQETPVRFAQFSDIASLFSSQVTTATINIGLNIHPVDFSSTPKNVWGLLTELNLKLYSQEGFEVNLVDISSAVICHCLALEILKFKVVSSNDDSFEIEDETVGNRWPQTMGDIQLRHLTMLSLSLPPTTDAVEFVGHLYLPSIKQLDFDFAGYRGHGFFARAEEILKLALRSGATGGGISLGLYMPVWIGTYAEMLQLLQHISYVKALKISSARINHNRWSVLLSQIFHFHHIFNDNLLSALSPGGKEYSQILFPRLEVLEYDNNVLTSITEQGFRNFVEARREAHISDGRIAAIRKLCIFINNCKQEMRVDEKLSLENDSAIYFRKVKNDPFSPWEGLEARTKDGMKPKDCGPVERVIYTEI